MKYSENYSKRKSKGTTGFYIVIACCLLAIGGASWFAAASIKQRGEIQKNENNTVTPSIEAPAVPEEEEEAETPSVDASDTVEDEPYTSEEAEAPVEEKKQVFIMPVEGEIIKPYSEKELLYSATFGDMRVHYGIDISCEKGTSVSACSDGTVVSVEESSNLGTVVTIDHGNRITAKYACLEEVKFSVGQKVSAGDILGVVGTIPSECADQTHLHFEVYKNGFTASPTETLHIN